jgi:hypothetical protein
MLPDHIGQLKPHQLTRHSLSDEVLAFTDHAAHHNEIDAGPGMMSLPCKIGVPCGTHVMARQIAPDREWPLA